MRLERDELDGLLHDAPSPTALRPIPKTKEAHTAPPPVKRKLAHSLSVVLTGPQDTERVDGRKRRRDAERERESDVPYERQYIFYRPPITGQSVSVTNTAGDRVYLIVSPPTVAAPLPPARRGPLGLLDTPVALLRAQINEQQSALALQHSLEAPSAPPSFASSARSASLWVDKYRPRSFVELLSPEDVNRDVLSWLKAWDICVFGRERNAHREHSNTRQAQQNAFLHNQANLPPSASTPAPSTGPSGLSSRPEPRVLLLSGPPGLGKTTMAHVLARHCGYHPLEINASDDRTEEQLIEKVRGAVEYRESGWGNAGMKAEKPHCLIIDEIDGVMEGSGGAITALLKLVAAETTTASHPRAGEDDGEGAAEAKGDGEDDDDEEGAAGAAPAPEGQDKGKGKGRKAGAKGATLPPLRRPIVCICNDPFVPALRALRAVSAHFAVSSPSKAALLLRLRHIARKEALDIDDRALSTIVDLTAADVRASINALQWLHQRTAAGAARPPRITVDTLRNVGVGVKDLTKGRFDLLDRVLGGGKRTSTHVKRITADGKEDAVKDVLAACQGVDDGQRFVSALHRNYLGLSLADPTLSVMAGLAEAFSGGDGRWGEGGGGEEEEGAMGATWPVLAVRVYREAARSVRRHARVEMDDSWKLHSEHERRRLVLHDWLLSPDNDSALAASSSLSVSLLATQLLGHVLLIVNPPLRPVAFNLLYPHERRTLDRLIAVMADLGLAYEPRASSALPTHAVGGAPEFPMVPRVDALCEYGWTDEPVAWIMEGRWTAEKWGKAPKPKATSITDAAPPRDVLPSKVRQMLWKEVEYERIRRQERRRVEGSTTTTAPAALSAPVLPSSDPVEERVGWRAQRAKDERKKEELRQRAQDREAGRGDRPTPPAERPLQRKGTFLSEHSARLKEKAAKDVKATRPPGDGAGMGVADGRARGAGSGFHFQFKEGFTQAVRRRVTMAHFT